MKVLVNKSCASSELKIANARHLLLDGLGEGVDFLELCRLQLLEGCNGDSYVNFGAAASIFAGSCILFASQISISVQRLPYLPVRASCSPPRFQKSIYIYILPAAIDAASDEDDDDDDDSILLTLGSFNFGDTRIIQFR